MQTTSTIQDTEKIISLLARMPMLKMFSKEQLGMILKYTTIRIYEFGETIIAEGALERTFFIMISGSVYVLKNGVRLSTLDKPGDLFGEMTIIDGSARSASIVAQERTICIGINASFLENAADSEQALMCQNILFRAVAQLLAERVRSMNLEIVTIRKELADVRAGKKPKGS